MPGDVGGALAGAEALEIGIETTPWSDVHRAWDLARGPLRYADALYVAAAERHRTALLTADRQIGRSGARIACQVIII